jgi:iron complex transport system substrate-binding protein
VISEPIEFLGAHNVAAELHGAHDPAGDRLEPRDHRLRRPGIRRAGAQRSSVGGDRRGLSPKLPFGWIDYPPAVNRLIGLWWLAKIFYPDRFPEDIKTLTRHFYTVFIM